MEIFSAITYECSFNSISFTRCEQKLRKLAMKRGRSFFPFVCLRLPVSMTCCIFICSDGLEYGCTKMTYFISIILIQDVVGEREVPSSRHFEYQVAPCRSQLIQCSCFLVRHKVQFSSLLLTSLYKLDTC